MAEARSPGVSYQTLLDRDTRPQNVPSALRWQSNDDLGVDPIPRERYVSREMHDLERERMWKRTWQMACREDDVAAPGDVVVYEICDVSVVVVRTDGGEIAAHLNACLHRGRQLVDGPGNVTELRCAFHGFCWNLDGSLHQVPCAWDFPHVRAEEWTLPAVRVGTWGGFVFVNLDPECESLESFLGDFPAQWDKWPLERRVTAAHVAKVFAANWKVVQEAFMEALHVVATHPQLLPAIGDTNSQYDWSGNWSRAITANFTPSPHLRDVSPDESLRGRVGDGGRARLSKSIGADAEALSDAEICDSFYFSVFPNFHPWGAYNQITYRFRPLGDRHDMSLMEVLLLDPWDGSLPKPRPAEVHHLGVDEPWSDAPELGPLAAIFAQDSGNIPFVQKGLASLRRDITLSAYQETKIRHFHALLGRTLIVD